MAELANKVALVTGGASGLGKAIAQRLKLEGADVVISDVVASAGNASATEIGATFLSQEVSDEARWAEIVQVIEQRFGRLDILVNNAGILGSMAAVSPEDTTLADWQRVFAVNVEGVFLGCRAAIPVIARAGGGSIVNVSSIAGLTATPYGTAYGASKAAVRQLTKSVAQHCAERRLNIRCNSVHPGNVRTPQWEAQARENAAKRGISVDDLVAEVASRVPLGDLTRPEDVAAMVSFLVSDDARHVTGAQMIVDGGVINCDTYHRTASIRALETRAKAARS